MALRMPVTEFLRRISGISANIYDVEKVGKEDKKISEFRIALSQFVAFTFGDILVLGLGMVLTYSTIVIPALLGAKNGIKFTEEQASWFGSIVFIFIPIGGIAVGFISEVWGRKRTMVLVNFPYILGWFLMYTAYDIYQLFAAAAILGLAIGFTESPTLNYAGETCQPKYRGALIQYGQIYVSIGHFLMSLVGALTDWQTGAAIASSVPMAAAILIALIPESPVWLLSKGRDEDAQKSLSWLRGWATAEDVKDEFQDLVKCNESEVKKAKKSLCCLGVDDFFRNDVIRPLILISIFQIFAHVSGMPATRPYLVPIFKQFGSSLDPYWCVVVNTVVGILGNLTASLSIAKLGKRKICHISFLAGAACCFFISLYGFLFIGTDTSWIPVTLYFLLNFSWCFGIGTMGWQLVSEVFPIRGRSIASGVSSAFTNLISFAATKTYYDLTYAFTLPGIFAFFCVTNIIGWIFFYFLIPETEGKSSEEAQNLFANVLKKKKRCQLRIPSIKLTEADVGDTNCNTNFNSVQLSSLDLVY